jgi:NMD protein affecting ribosome stability and mRNA decay
MKATFCAICIDESDDLKPEIMDGREVVVCNTCRTTHPRSGRYSFESSSRESPRPLKGTEGGHEH